MAQPSVQPGSASPSATSRGGGRLSVSRSALGGRGQGPRRVCQAGPFPTTDRRTGRCTLVTGPRLTLPCLARPTFRGLRHGREMQQPSPRACHPHNWTISLSHLADVSGTQTFILPAATVGRREAATLPSSSVGIRRCRAQSSGPGRWTVGKVAQPPACAECHRNTPLETAPAPPGTASRTKSTEERQEPPAARGSAHRGCAGHGVLRAGQRAPGRAHGR